MKAFRLKIANTLALVWQLLPMRLRPGDQLWGNSSDNTITGTCPAGPTRSMRPLAPRGSVCDPF